MNLICKFFGHRFYLVHQEPVMEILLSERVFSGEIMRREVFTDRCVRCGLPAAPATREQVYEEVRSFANENDRVSMADVLRVIRGDK